MCESWVNSGGQSPNFERLPILSSGNHSLGHKPSCIQLQAFCLVFLALVNVSWQLLRSVASAACAICIVHRFLKYSRTVYLTKESKALREFCSAQGWIVRPSRILLVSFVDVCSMKRLPQNGSNVRVSSSSKRFNGVWLGSTSERKGKKNNYSFLPSYCLYISPVITIMTKKWIDTG